VSDHVCHRLELEHGNRRCYLPTCVCGWVGIWAKRRSAEGEYRKHLRTSEREAHAGGDNQTTRRAVTPARLLPELLR